MSSRRNHCSRLLAGAGIFLLLGGLAVRARADEGRLTLTPSVEVSQSFDSDEIVLQNGEESGSVFEVTPGFRARAERPGTRLDVQTSVRSRSSTADSDLSAVDETGRLAFQTNLTPRFTAVANGSFRNREAQDPLDADDGAELQVGRPDLHEATGDLTLAYAVTARSQISVGYSDFTRNYQGSESRSNANRDIDVGAWTLGYSSALSPLDRVGLSLSYQQLNFGEIDGPSIGGRRAEIQDQDDRIAAVFASWSRALTPIWSADLSAGVRRLDSEGGGFRGLVSEVGDAGQDDTSTGFIGSLFFTRQTEWNRTRLGYRRETRPSGGIGTSLDVDTFEVSFTQQLMRNLSFKVRGNYEISKSANDSLVPFDAQRIMLTIPGGSMIAVPVCPATSIGASLGGSPACLIRNSNSVDTTVLRLGAELTWRWTRGFVTFLSYDFRDQNVNGIVGGLDRNSSRVRFGFRYAFDYEAF